ncbi:hypothetical protein BOTBODRAFT_38071 [Botryobasidium botryosum FD-172 SS1]|uniref:GP-PDE domain-containing protein n=1 Tax=Botryobasidium botryosum (strain FD-172 SS1) TaxID=930990 RepID=A0A067M0N9_BOTB1|nr:hypothetical protein BOTBODRAFT_38071 [Botryobasidium botryosum FD-172 SS1]
MSIPTASDLPQCWGHRGASAAFPENTLASFEAAMRDGAEGIESDVHVSRDGVVVMFHDPHLHRTTDGKGAIRELDWHGEQGMQHVRTIKEPRQSIPTFAETIALLMKPENSHVLFNVDVKVQNDPERLFKLMNDIIVSYPSWGTVLAPRIILGLWHPKFIAPAHKELPYLRRAHIGTSPSFARTYFFDSCEAFSMSFASLCTPEGTKFREDCQKAGKSVMVWTVNRPEEMLEAVRWGVRAILTDVTKVWLNLRDELAADSARLSRPTLLSRLFLWLRLDYYTAVQKSQWIADISSLERQGGPFMLVQLPVTVTA